MKTTPSRQEGSALVVVLMFGVLVLLMVGSLLISTSADMNNEFESHKTKALSVVLRTAFQDATYEINRHRLAAGTFDPDGDGVGALGTGLGGAPNGIQVLDANGQLLGLYRTTVQTDPEGIVIRAFAVLPRDPRNPDFVNPRSAVASKLMIEPGTLMISPSSAFDLPGVDPDKVKFQVKKDSNLKILSGAPTIDATVPAMNISNPDFFTDFVTAYGGTKVKDLKVDDKGDMQIEGMDPANPGTTTTGAPAIANNPAQAWTEAAVQGMSQAIGEYVEAKTDAAYADPGLISLRDYAVANLPAADIDKDTDDDIHVKNSATLYLPDGVYEARKLKLEDNVAIIGTGTLIVSEKFEIKDNSQLQWNGDIIVVGDDEDDNKKGELKVKDGGSISGTGEILTAGKVKIGGDDQVATDDPSLNWTGNVLVVSGEHKDHYHKAEMKIEKEGNFYVDGTVALAGYDKEAKFEVKKDGDITIDGSLLVLSGQAPDDDEDDGKKAKAKLKFDKGGTVTVNGLLTIMGSEIKFEVKKDETLNVNGSTILLLTEAKKSKLKFKVDKDSNVTLVHDFDNILMGAEDLQLFYADLIAALGGNPVPLPINHLAYWELEDARAVFNEQQAAIDAGAVGWTE